MPESANTPLTQAADQAPGGLDYSLDLSSQAKTSNPRSEGGRRKSVRLGLQDNALALPNKRLIRKEFDLAFIPTHLDHPCTGTRRSYRDRVQQLRHFNPVRPGALLPLRRKESD